MASVRRKSGARGKKKRKAKAKRPPEKPTQIEFVAPGQIPVDEKVPELAPQLMGRKPKYRRAMCVQIKKIAAMGATEYEIADFLGINVLTLYRWKAEYPDICKSLKLGTERGVRRVENALYHRAVGYSHEAVKIFCDKDGNVTKVPYIEHYPPDALAAKLWLTNRAPEKWRDVSKTLLETQPGKPLAMTYVPAQVELLETYYARLEQARTAADSDSGASSGVGPGGREGHEPAGDPFALPGGSLLPPR